MTFATEIEKFSNTPIVIVEIELDSGVVRFAKTDTELDNVLYEGRVISFGTVHRSISDIEGDFRIGDVISSFNDNDGYFSNMAWESLYNRKVSYFLGFEGLSYSGFKLLYSGVIYDFKSTASGAFHIHTKESTTKWLEKDYGGILESSDYNNAHIDIADKKMPIIYGEHTGGYGILRAYCIDTSSDIWIAAGHEMDEITEVYFPVSSPTDEPTLKNPSHYTVDTTATYANGLNGDITTITFTSGAPDPATTPVYFNGKGMKSGGSLISNPALVIEHYITEYLGMTTDDYNDTDFTTEETEYDNRGYICAGAIYDFQSPRKIIEDIARSFNMTTFFDESGLFTIKSLD